MTDLEQDIRHTLVTRGGAVDPPVALLETSRRRGLTRRRRRRVAIAVSAVAAAAVLVAAVPALWAAVNRGGPAAETLQFAVGPEVPGAAARPDLVGTDPAVLHFTAEALVRDMQRVRWRSGSGVERLEAATPEHVTNIDVGRDPAALERLPREGAFTETGTVSPLRMAGRPATLERIDTSDVVGWVLRWQPADGVWARLETVAADRDAVLAMAGDVDFAASQGCRVPFRLAALPPGARILGCDAGLSRDVRQRFYEASLLIGDGRGRSMTVRVEQTEDGLRGQRPNGEVGGRPAVLSPDTGRLEVQGYENLVVKAYYGKTYSGYDKSDAATVLGGIRMVPEPREVATWPVGFVAR